MKRLGTIALLVIGLLTLPWWIRSQYLLHLVNLSGVNTMLAIGLLFIFGYCGQLSLCQAAFFGIAAYTTALLTTGLGVNPWLGMGAGMAFAGVVGAGIGAAILRLRGHYFALASFGFGEIVSQILLNWKDVTRGTDGIVNIPQPAIGGFTFASNVEFYYLIAACVATLALVAERIRCSRYGRAFLAVRADALAAGVAGLDVFRVKWTAFVLSALYAGLGGAIYAHMFAFISPEAFGFMVSVNVMAMVLVGGVAQLWGVLVGSVIVTVLPEVLRFSREYYMVLYGLGLAAVVVFLPDGISGRLRSFGSRAAHGEAASRPAGSAAVDHR